MNKLPGFGLIERAQALQPLIAREADEIERTRRFTEPVVSALIENGLLPDAVAAEPRRCRRAVAIFMQVLEEIAKADASTAWCLGQCSVCSMTAAYIDPDAAREIFNTPPGILAWGAIANEMHVVPGGYRITARWDFASGSRQASWLGAHVQVVEADGTRRLRIQRRAGNPNDPVPDGERHHVRRLGRDRPQRYRHRFYSVDNLFIPEKFAALRDNFSALREKGPLYGITTYSMFGLGFAAIALGVARATLDAAIELARGKELVGLKAMRENNAVQGLIGRTEGDLRAARAYLFATAAEGWRDLTRTGKLSEDHRAAFRSPRALDHPSGDRGGRRRLSHDRAPLRVFRANPFERRFRDMHAIAQQIQARDTHYEDVGRMILTASSIPRGPTT